MKEVENNKKIIFFIDSPGYGGSEINAIKLIKALKIEYQIELVLNKIHCKQISDFAKCNNLPVHLFNVGNNKKYILFGLIKANRILKKFKKDLVIIWCHHLDSNRWVQLTAAFKNLKYIIVEQLLPTEYAHLSKSMLTIPIKKYVTSRSVTNVICAFSQVDNYQKIFKTKNVTIIPNSRDIKNIQQKVNRYKQTFQVPISLKGFCITYIGRLTDQKDPLTIIKAVHELKNKFPITLIMIGEGELQPILKNYIEKFKIDNVFLIGYDETPLRWLAFADMFIINSLSEGLPGALIEAMAAGVPCIATNIPGNNELIINEKTGLLIQVKNEKSLQKEIEKMILKPELRKELANNAYNHVLENYDKSIEEKKWFDLLKKI